MSSGMRGRSVLLVALWGCGGATAATLVVAEAVTPAETPAPEPAPAYIPPTLDELLTRCEGAVAPTSPSFHPPEWFLVGRDRAPLYGRTDELARRARDLRAAVDARGEDDPRRPDQLRELGAVSCELANITTESDSIDAFNECLQAYAQVVQDHPDYERMGDVFYELAIALDQLEQYDQSREVYRRLIKGFPDSRWVGAAYGSFARFYRREGDHRAASQFWSKVAYDNPESSLAGYARYDLGWIAAETGVPSDAKPRWLEALRWIEAHPNAPLAAELARAIERDFCAALSPQPNAADPPPP